jgi:hypothetical protein
MLYNILVLRGSSTHSTSYEQIKSPLEVYGYKNNDEIKWNFHDDLFSQQDWTKRPAGTLKDLYKQRAQQLRDSYDYLVLNFSGGADSWNILHTFLTNNIKLDEIYTRWGRAERKYKSADPFDIKEGNLGSEFEYAVVPVLDYVRKNYPQINIVIDDYSECYQQDFKEEYLFLSDHYQLMPSPFRYGRKSEKEIALENKNKKIGVIYGYDKIRCKVENENFYAYFSDGMSGSYDSDITSNRKFELFYYSIDLPQLPILQAHYIKESLSILPLSMDIKTIKKYRDLYTIVCYPEYNRDTLQVNKLLGTHISNSDSWIHSYNPRYFKSWKWHYDQLFNSIDKKFLWQPQNTSLNTGVKSSNSKYYLIGKITDYEKNNLLNFLSI